MEFKFEIDKERFNEDTIDKYLLDYLNHPVFTQLQCDNMQCIYNEPKDVIMGVITYCSKYKNGEKGCKNREWKELMFK